MDRLEPADDAAWARAEAALAAGQLVAVPTDTVYGVAAAVACPSAVVRLFALKDRSAAKPVAVLVADAAQAAELAEVDPVARRLAHAFWPGALTMVLPRRRDFTVDLGGAGDTVGVRAPAHDRLVELCRRLGPLATTSANRSGHPTPPDGRGVALELAGTEVALVIDDGLAPGGVASTVVRIDAGELTVLRDGPVSLGDLQGAAGESP